MKQFSLVRFMSCLIIFLITVIFLTSTQVSAQFIPYPAPYYDPYFAFVPPVPYFPAAPVFAPPLFDPYLALPTAASRTAAATIILAPTTPVVTAAAPLGTLSLTPSTLVFLILFLSLAE
ncbi:MAG: hypothetical protein AB1611_06055 [bacterium]